MLSRLLNLFLRSPQIPTPVATFGFDASDDARANQVVLYARIEKPEVKGPGHPPRPTKTAIRKRSPQAGHRQRLLGMKLEYTRLCSPHRCRRLSELGIVTAGDLASTNPEWLARHFSAPRKVLAIIKRYRRAIRLAAAVPGMMPRDALLLVSIHRRSVRGLACESPAALHRDLARYAESTKGRSQLRGRRIPSTRRLRRWIAECETVAVRNPLQARVA